MDRRAGMEQAIFRGALRVRPDCEKSSARSLIGKLPRAGGIVHMAMLVSISTLYLVVLGRMTYYRLWLAGAE